MRQILVGFKDHDLKKIEAWASFTGVSRQQLVRNAVARYIGDFARAEKRKVKSKPKSVEDLFKDNKLSK